MTRFPKEMTENGIHYTLHGDYYFPDLDLPDFPRQTIGRYIRPSRAWAGISFSVLRYRAHKLERRRATCVPIRPRP